jgi:hypothetical protein
MRQEIETSNTTPNTPHQQCPSPWQHDRTSVFCRGKEALADNIIRAAHEESQMNLKIIVAVSVLAAMPAVATAQQATGPKPTKADVQKVVQIISGDKAKTSLYCDLGKLEDEMAQADEKKDQKKSEELGKQADAMGQKLGPEYIKLMAGLEQVDPDSNEGKDLSTALEALDKLCPKK